MPCCASFIYYKDKKQQKNAKTLFDKILTKALKYETKQAKKATIWIKKSETAAHFSPAAIDIPHFRLYLCGRKTPVATEITIENTG